MALDRFVKWKKNQEKPTAEQLRMLLEDYLGEEAKQIVFEDRRFFITLRGKPSYPFRRFPGYEHMAKSAEWHELRCFEVCVADDNIDVITRQADEFTNVVAEGFAAMCRRFWKGKSGL